MPRVARIVLPGVPHHVTQRGNNRQEVFFVDDDRRYYLSMLKAQSERFGLRVLGYCLMPNHVHLVIVPEREESLARGLGRAHFLYTQYINRLHKLSGHLWQNRFFSCAMEDTHLWRAMCYVERNPLRARPRLARTAADYPWSSAAAHCGEPDESGLLDAKLWRELWGRGDWSAVLRRPEDDADVRQIRLSTHTGRPLATDSLLSRLERRLGRRLRPLPVGRPRKKERGKPRRPK